jgi:hypothetical protein
MSIKILTKKAENNKNNINISGINFLTGFLKYGRHIALRMRKDK